MSQSRRLENKVALVTGATRGIGLAVAVALAREGCHLVLTGRTQGALEEADDAVRGAGSAATLITLNLKHADKIDTLGPVLFQRWGRLDILVGNAGILGPISPLGHVTADAWSEIMDINVSANWRLIRTLDPLLRRSAAGRAIFVTSGAAAARNAYWGPYSVSKAALEALVKTYAREVEASPVRANLINPGPIRTNMRAKAFPGEDPTTLATPDDIAPHFVAMALASETHNGGIFDFATKSWR